MDIFLGKLTQQAMNYAIRSGITITSGFAIQQCSRLLKVHQNVPSCTSLAKMAENIHSQQHDELSDLQRKLDSKIKIIAPAIDMIELIAARGNTSLESAVSLTKSIRWDIQQLGARIAQAATEEESLNNASARPKSRDAAESELRLIISDVKYLLGRIEDAVPLINLAITTSGASLSASLPASISPSRLLQASTFLSAGDAQYSIDSSRPLQIGPRFTLSMYMLFQGHANKATDEEGMRSTIWQEVIHKAQIKLVRVPLKRLNDLPFASDASDQQPQSREGSSTYSTSTEHQVPADLPSHEFAYQLSIIEDLDDDRVHSLEDAGFQPGPMDDTANAGICTFIPVHQISKVFYADTGKILNIGTDGESNNPVILLKRDTNAEPPRRLMEANDFAEDDKGSFVSEHPENTTGAHRARSARDIPAGLDLDWVALEVYTEAPDSESEDDDEKRTEIAPSSRPSSSYMSSMDVTFATAMSRLNISSTPPTPVSDRKKLGESAAFLRKLPTNQAVTSSLSLLEMLIRLASLQQFQQASHLTISDELLNFFLEESSTTGAAPGDAEARKRIRWEARQHVGFDPYDESPIKRRGEAYQRQWRGASEPPYGAWPDDGSGFPDTPASPLEHKRPPSARSSTPAKVQSTPPLPGDKPVSSPLASPSSVPMSRAEFIREEQRGKTNARSQSSPLAQPALSNEWNESDGG